MQPEILTPEPLLRMATGFWAAQTLFVATELKVFTKIADAPKTLDELIQALGIGSRAAKALLDACVALGLLQRKGNSYANSPLSAAFLKEGQPRYFGDFVRLQGTRMYANWARLRDAVLTGRPVGKFLDLVKTDPRYAQDFTRALFNNGVPTATALASEIDFSRHTTMLDLGGGSGVYSIMIAKRYPRLKAIVFDFPVVCAVASDFIEKHELATQVTVAGGDFFQDPLPRGVDVVLIANVLHDIGSDASRSLLSKAHKILRDGGEIVLVEYLLNEDRTGPPFSGLFGLTMLIETERGEVYTERDIRTFLGETGYQEVELRELPGPSTAIVAKKL